FTIYTRWIETEFDNTIPAFAGAAGEAEEAETAVRRTVVVEVGGKRLEVSLPEAFGAASTGGAGGVRKAPRRQANRRAAAAVSGESLTSPMQGTIVKVAVEDGRRVEEGDLIVVLEAMKMEQPINAHRSGIVKDFSVEVGASIAAGSVICEIKD
ncbi:acetyl-CoA carboxylase biotin carboxyl carrier protein subunit, partial [Kitasatospora sp. NPDC059648]|uniref:acetyl-CoA carboxylase biotin carboxyl carrier protein subunit n=1 Tax=Kitasatospora sp. NPDC059648 TaxID=3346894 RepID=UPI0036A51851